MSRQLSELYRHLTQISWLILLAIVKGFPDLTHAAEAPGALTVIVRDHIINRPISDAQITLTERETNVTRSAQTDAQGRIVVELVNEHELLVTNQLSSDPDGRHTSLESSSQGYGLGLGIVQRLCEHNGWTFSLLVDEARVAARLSW